MIGFAFGGILMGRLADRLGIVPPLLIGAIATRRRLRRCPAGTDQYLAACASCTVGIGLFGTSAMFGPLMADISHWFVRRRGIAVAIAAAGNYLAGTIWPPILQYLIATVGWRETHIDRRRVLRRHDAAAGAGVAPAAGAARSRRRGRGGRGGARLARASRRTR